MLQKISFFLLWLTFVSYAFLFAPNAQDPSETIALIQHLSTSQWDGINPLIVALFNLMGIWPMVYGAVLFADGCSQKIPAWPFAAGSFAFGAFALVPYLALRESAPVPPEALNRTLKFWDSRWLGIVLMGGAIALSLYGLTQGNWPDFIQQWQSSRFIHVMSLDFCLLSLLFPTLMVDDLARRNMDLRWWVIGVIPLLGPLAYLVLRSPLQSERPQVQQQPNG